ncbi:MAG: DinB family protein [Lewinellaceae bacterium]|nr:DinB family protein [Lewinellaceae bacterium]
MIPQLSVFALAICCGTVVSPQGCTYLTEVLAKWDNASAYTLETARAMPGDQFDFKASEEEMSFGAQLDHIASNMVWLSEGYLGAAHFEHPLRENTARTPEESVSYLEAALQFTREAIAATDVGTLSETKSFFAGPMSKRQILTLMNDHQTPHRGQLVVYLRLKGIQPPKYRGW